MFQKNIFIITLYFLDLSHGNTIKRVIYFIYHIFKNKQDLVI